MKTKSVSGKGVISEDAQIPLAKIKLINAIYGLVHPHTDQQIEYEAVTENQRRYLRFIDEVAKDPAKVLVFVGTAKKEEVERLRRLDGKTSARLQSDFVEMSEDDRGSLRGDLGKAGIYIKSNVRYLYLEELSLLHHAATTVDPARLIYFQSQIKPDELNKRLGGGFDADSVDVVFRGEDPRICVRDQAKILSKTLDIPQTQVNAGGFLAV